jgi:hypothetical protein
MAEPSPSSAAEAPGPLPADSSSTPATPRHALRLHPVNAALMLGLLLASFWLCGVFTGRMGFTDGIVAFVTPLMVFFVGLILGLIALWICKRSSRVFNVVLGLVVGFALVWTCYVAVQRGSHGSAQRRPAAIDPAGKAELAAIAEDMRAENRRRAAAGQTGPDPEHVERYVKRIEDLAAKYSGSTAAVLKANAKFQREIGAASNASLAALKAFMDAGGLNPSTFKDKHDLETRAGLLRDAIRANDEVRRIAVVSGNAYEQTLRSAGMSAGEIPAPVSEFMSGGAANSYATLSGATGRMFNSAAQYLSILSDNWGHWAANGGRVVFDSAAQADAFSKILAELREATEAMRALKDGGSKDAAPAARNLTGK